MSPRLSVTAFALSIVLFVAFVVLWILDLGIDAPINFGNEAGRLVQAVSGLIFAVVGWLIASRRVENRVGWVTLTIGLTIIVTSFSVEYGVYSTLTAPGSLPGGEIFGWLGNWIWVIPVGLLGNVLVLLYPDGRLASPGWRPVMVAAVAGMLGAMAFFGFAPGPLVSLPWIDNPVGLAGSGSWIEFLSLGMFILMATIPMAAWSLRRRYLRETGVARDQIKWFVAAASLVALIYVGQFVYSVATGTLDGGSEAQRWIQTLAVAGFGALGASVGIAILRHRLYDIDKIISRTVSHGILIALLGGVFFGIVSLFTLFLPSGEPLVVALATLAAAALFEPLRRRVHEAVDRRFNRSHFDAQRIVEGFSGTIQGTSDVDLVMDGWIGVVADTMQPVAVGVWVRES